MQTVKWGKRHQESVLQSDRSSSLRLDAEVHLNVSWTGFKGEAVRHCRSAITWALPRWPEKIHSLFPVSSPLTLTLQTRHRKSVRKPSTHNPAVHIRELHAAEVQRHDPYINKLRYFEAFVYSDSWAFSLKHIMWCIGAQLMNTIQDVWL